MGFSRQEYWSGLPFPSPGDRPDPSVEPRSLTLRADSLPSEPRGKPENMLGVRKNLEIRVVAVVQLFKHVLLFAAPLTVARLDPLFMGFPRQEYWSGLLFPPPGNCPNSGIKVMSLV